MFRKMQVNGWIADPQHGPQEWPWWRWISFAWVTVGGTGRRLWIYTRWGSLDIDFYSHAEAA